MPTLRRPTLPFSRMPSPRWSAGALQSDWLRDVLNPPVNRERCTMGRRLDGPSADWTPCWSAPDEVLCSGQWAMAGKDVDMAQGSAADDKEAWGFRIKAEAIFCCRTVWLQLAPARLCSRVLCPDASGGWQLPQPATGAPSCPCGWYEVLVLHTVDRTGAVLRTMGEVE